MTKRILIVEAEKDHALQMAVALKEAGHAPRLAHTGAEAILEVKDGRHDLLVIRAELPDQSGFGLCSTFKREGEGPVILISSESSAEAIAEHASTAPHPADAYLAMPFEMEGLAQAVAKLAAPPTPPKLPGGPPTLPRMEQTKRPPSLGTPPTAPLRDEVTPEERAFVERVFGGVAHRKRELLADGGGMGERPLPRDAVNTPEGRLCLLREEVRSRDVQLARLSEIWPIQERQLSKAEDRRRELEVEAAGLRMQLEGERRKSKDALHLASQREREHGESVNHLLLERFAQEKELIEVVAEKERDIGLLRRDVEKRDRRIEGMKEKVERVETLEELLHQAREQILADAERIAILEEELAASAADRKRIEAALLQEIEALRAGEQGEEDVPLDVEVEVEGENTSSWELGGEKEPPPEAGER